MAGNTSTEHLIELREALAPTSPAMNRALTRIGTLLRSEMVLNITRMRAIDTGNLRSSIAYEFHETNEGSELNVGSYGVPYARVIEYGFSGPQQVRAHIRQIREAFGKPLEEPRAVNVRAHVRVIPEGSRPARPFARNALAKHRQRIIEILQEELGAA